MNQKHDVLVVLIYSALVVLLSSSCDGPAAPQPAATATVSSPSATPSPFPATPAPDPAKPAGPLLEQTSTSPDGRWSAYSLASAPVVSATSPTGMAYRAVLRLSHTDGRQWTAVDEWRPSGLGWTWPAVLQWSQSAEAVYYTNVPVPDGCTLFVNGSDLWRLDLATGQVTQLAPELSLRIALSPDEKTLAYIARGAPELVLRDLATGAERRARIATEGQEAGDIHWSPDGAALEIRVASEPCSNATTYATVRVDARLIPPAPFACTPGALSSGGGS